MSNRIAILSLVIICTVFVFSWYKPGLVIGGAEEGLSFLNPQRTEELFKYTWEDIHYGGPQTAEMTRVPYFLLASYLGSIGIPADLIQILTFLFLILTSAIFMYLLTKEVIGNMPIYCFIAALFYIFNSFMFANIWNRFLIAMFFFEPLLPLAIYFLYKFFKTRNILYLPLFLFVSFIFSSAFSLPSNIITLWIILSILLLSKLIEHRNSWRSMLGYISWFLLFLITWILVNIWWLIPLNYQETAVYSQIFSSSENITTLRSLSNAFPFLTTITLGYKKIFSFWQIIISFIMLIIVGIGIRDVKIKTWRNFLLIVILLGYFVLNGSNFPTGGLFEFFFIKVSQLQLFRNPYEKFGITITLVYSLLFPLGIKYLSKFSRIISICLVVLIFGALFLPLWSDKTFGDKDTNFYVNVPNDYSKVNTLVNQDLDRFRILQLPLLTSGGSAYNWPHKYFGSHPNFYLFDKTSLEGLTSFREPDNYWKILREGFYNGKISQLLKYANIKYLILHKDIDIKYSQTDDLQITQLYLRYGLIPDVNSSSIICPDITDLKPHPDGLSSFEQCKLDIAHSDWSRDTFLNFELDSNTAGQIRVDIIDQDDQRLVFSGKIEDTYTIRQDEIGSFKQFTLDFRIPTEKYTKFSPSKIDRLEISFESKAGTSNPDVKIRNIYLTKGMKVSNDYAEIILSTPNIDLYKIKDKYFYPRIYASAKISQINNWDSLIKFDNLPDAFYLMSQQDKKVNYDFVSQPPDINFKKLNNTEYNISVKNAKIPFWLVFSENFSPDWKAISSNQNFLHFQVNGFTNGYFIDRTGDFNISLIYEEQILADKLKGISLFVFILIVLFALIIKRKIFKFSSKQKQIN